MNGLGIVLEEREPSIDDKSQSPLIHPEPSSTEEESLLPPLPDSSTSSIDPQAPNAIVDWIHTNSYSPVSTLDSHTSGAASRAGSRSDSLGSDHDSRRESNYSDFLQSLTFEAYRLDSPTDSVQPFPSETSLTSHMIAPTSTPGTTVSTNGTNNNSSPLKRLKSIRNTIRKLSLSSNGSSVSKPGSSTNSPNIPTGSFSSNALKNRTASLLVDTSATDNNDLGLSTCDSMNSGSYPFPSISAIKELRGLDTPSTPPFASPVVTLSDNLLASKRTLSNVEQSYFDSVSTSRTQPTSVASSVLSGMLSTMETSHQRIKSISELTTLDELLDYSSFLHQQRDTVVHAFEVAHKRLQESGWCSTHDLQNLQLQQDTSLCQLDTKLLQVEEKLNAEFDTSIFNNKPQQEKKGKEKELPRSPSLKVLESRCFSFADL
ncbi:hypothetical protein QFC19_000345 [Naganishia cerealis]|uniref:Uncharacterized protein n=1 Tax=Naganishia cerealis TaxID=610337 RepID=A0ACC2WNS2_9TREE|nr:hypothetical protein QFC19_000345 [Naganishia cerealis]